MKERCKTCGIEIEVEGKYHAGFSQVGFLYCDCDSTVLTFAVYDKGFMSIIPDRAPWDLSDDEKKQVEKHLVDCPCGGRFLFKNPLRCPLCGGAFAAPVSLDQIYFVIVGARIDSEKKNIWKDKEVKEKA